MSMNDICYDQKISEKVEEFQNTVNRKGGSLKSLPKSRRFSALSGDLAGMTWWC